MKEQPSKEVWFKFKDLYDLNMSEFISELNDAIEHKNLQSVYQLSKIITRYHFKYLDT